ncbi:hypothetical protein Dimus_018311 [Dionaea muscipula]
MDRQEGVHAIGCSVVVLSLPSADARLAMDEASKLPADGGPRDEGRSSTPPVPMPISACVCSGPGSTATSRPASAERRDAATLVARDSRRLRILSRSRVGDGVRHPSMVNYGVGGASGEQEAEVGVGRAASAMPTYLVCSSSPSSYVSDDDVIADGLVREEVRLHRRPWRHRGHNLLMGCGSHPRCQWCTCQRGRRWRRWSVELFKASRTYAHVVHAHRRRI